MRLTEKAIDTYNFIRSFAVEHNYLPSVRDIQEGMGYKSKSTVWMHMLKLEAFGYINRRFQDGYQYSVKGLKYVIEGEN